MCEAQVKIFTELLTSFSPPNNSMRLVLSPFQMKGICKFPLQRGEAVFPESHRKISKAVAWTQPHVWPLTLNSFIVPGEWISADSCDRSRTGTWVLLLFLRCPWARKPKGRVQKPLHFVILVVTPNSEILWLYHLEVGRWRQVDPEQQT